HVTPYTRALLAQQRVDSHLRPRLRIDALDDHGAVQAVLAVARRERAGHDDGAGGDASVGDFIALAIVDARARADEYAHRDHGTFLDDDTFDDLRARADEAVVFDDRGIRLQRLQDA